MDWTGFILHGGRTGSGDAALDTVLLLVPIVLAALVLLVPRLLASYQHRARDEHEALPSETDGPARSRRHGDEPV